MNEVTLSPSHSDLWLSVKASFSPFSPQCHQLESEFKISLSQVHPLIEPSNLTSDGKKAPSLTSAWNIRVLWHQEKNILWMGYILSQLPDTRSNSCCYDTRFFFKVNMIVEFKANGNTLRTNLAASRKFMSAQKATASWHRDIRHWYTRIYPLYRIYLDKKHRKIGKRVQSNTTTGA